MIRHHCTNHPGIQAIVHQAFKPPEAPARAGKDHREEAVFHGAKRARQAEWAASASSVRGTVEEAEFSIRGENAKGSILHPRNARRARDVPVVTEGQL